MQLQLLTLAQVQLQWTTRFLRTYVNVDADGVPRGHMLRAHEPFRCIYASGTHTLGHNECLV